MPDIFAGLAGAYGKAQDIADEDRQRKIAQAATLLGLTQQGLVPDSDAGKYTDYKALGDTGYGYSPSARVPTKMTSKPMSVNGVPTIVLEDERGNIFDAKTRQPITGDLSPTYRPPAPKPPVTIKRTPVVLPGSDKPILAYEHPNGTLTDDEFNVLAGATPYAPTDKGKSPAEIPGTPEWKAAEKYKASLIPRDDKVLVQVQDPNDPTKTIYISRAEAAGMQAPPKTGGGSASLSPEDRQKMLNQAKLDNDTMTAYENKVLASGKPVGVAAGMAGAATAAHGGVVKDMIGIAGNAATGAIDPEYQRYITAQRSYGRIMGNLQSKRYTDNQAEIERSISGLQGADLDGTVRYKQQLRNSSLAEPSATPASTGGRGGGGSAPPSATRAQQLWDAAVAKHGEAKVLAEFGPRPQ